MYNCIMDSETIPIDPFQAFVAIDLRVGRIVRAEFNKKARVPAYKLWLDFGDLGERTSSAQIIDLYQPEDLVGRLIVGAVNLGSRLIGGFKSEALVMGVGDADGRVVLLAVERDVAAGSKIYWRVRDQGQMSESGPPRTVIPLSRMLRFRSTIASDP